MRGSGDSPLIALEGVCKRYGAREVLHGVDLAVGGGECLALLGHNGAGKTTLIKLMLGLTRASAGRLRILGEDPGHPAAAALRRQIGYLPESVAFHDAMTGREVLGFYARLQGEPTSACDALLERVGLHDAARQRVRTYSKGMRQRLGLAQALLGRPRLLLLDEPTTGLDPVLRQQFYAQVAELRRSGVTVLISSHALTEVESRSDRVAIMKAGRLAACGTLEELRQAASLPVRIRVSVTPGTAASVAQDIGGRAELQKVNDSTVDLTCLGSDKMEMVRRIAGLGGPVRDLDIVPPRLEDLYAHYCGEAGPQ